MYVEELREFKTHARADQGQGRRNDRDRNPQKAREFPPPLRFAKYTPLNTGRARILEEALSAELIPAPRKFPLPPRVDQTKHCRYHRNHGHTTEECIALKDKIEELIQAGHLQRYVQRAGNRQYAQQRARTPEHWNPRPRANEQPRQERSRERSPRTCNNDGRTVINTISGGFGGGGLSHSARKRHLRIVKSVHVLDSRPRRTMPDIVFTDRDFRNIDTRQDDPMVIAIEVANCEIRKTLVDQGSSVDVLYWKTFKKMSLNEDAIIPLEEQIVGFSGERVDTKGYIDLRTKFGNTDRGHRMILVRYLIVDVNTSYNVLLGRPSLNKLGAIVSTPHLAMKFPTERGDVATVYADQRTTRECYVASLRLSPTITSTKRDVGQRMVAMTDLDPRMNDEIRMEPRDTVEEWQLGAEG